MHPLLNPDIAFIPEPEVLALARHVGFSADLFPRLYEVLPFLKGRFSFYRDPRTPDLWSICEPAARQSFGVQIDPEIEVICLWNADCHEEIGCWPPAIPDPTAHAIDRIREHYSSDAHRLRQ